MQTLGCTSLDGLKTFVDNVSRQNAERLFSVSVPVLDSIPCVLQLLYPPCTQLNGVCYGLISMGRTESPTVANLFNHDEFNCHGQQRPSLDVPKMQTLVKKCPIQFFDRTTRSGRINPNIYLKMYNSKGTCAVNKYCTAYRSLKG